MNTLNPFRILAELAGRSTKAKLAIAGTSFGSFWVVIAAAVQVYTGWSSEQIQRAWEIAALTIGGLGTVATALCGLAHTCEDIARKLWVTAPLPTEGLAAMEARLKAMEERLAAAHEWIVKNTPAVPASPPPITTTTTSVTKE